jgi:hypothetical protein
MPFQLRVAGIAHTVSNHAEMDDKGGCKCDRRLDWLRMAAGTRLEDYSNPQLQQ